LLLGFLPLLRAFEDFLGLLLELEGLAFRAVVFFVEDAFAFAALLPLFFAGRLALFGVFLDDAGFLEDFFTPAFFAVAFALAATALTAFFTGAGADLGEAAARPAIAPRTPPTTVPTGPATLPRTAPAAAPAACLEMGGISMFADDEPDASDAGDDDWFSSGMTS
jgi:hypothetical protein